MRTRSTAPSCSLMPSSFSVPLQRVSENSLVGRTNGLFLKVISRASLGVVDPPELDLLNARRFAVIDPHNEHTIPLCECAHGRISGEFPAIIRRDAAGADLILASPMIGKIGSWDARSHGTPRASIVHDFVVWYVQKAEEFGFAHNDLHAGNVIYDVARERLYLVDFGRTVWRDAWPGRRAAVVDTAAEMTNIARFTRRNVTERGLKHHLDLPEPLDVAPWAPDVLRFTTSTFFEGMLPAAGRDGICVPGAYVRANPPRVVFWQIGSAARVVSETLRDIADPNSYSGVPSELVPMAMFGAIGFALVHVVYLRLCAVMASGVERIHTKLEQVVLEANARAHNGAFDLLEMDVVYMSWYSAHVHLTVDDQLEMRRLVRGALAPSVLARLSGSQGGGDASTDDSASDAAMRRMFAVSESAALERRDAHRRAAPRPAPMEGGYGHGHGHGHVVTSCASLAAMSIAYAVAVAAAAFGGFH